MDTRASLLVMPGAAESGSEAVLAAAQSSGLDPRRLLIQLRGRGLSAAGRGSLEDVTAAARALDAAGLASAVVTNEEVHALPRVQQAGGIAPGDTGGVSLRVHGLPAGPPEGVPLLFVVADLGRHEVAPGAAQPRPGDSMRQRLLRAVYPVVDVTWSDGRLRVPLKGMTWRGLPGAGLSAPGNLLRLLELLTERGAGSIVDVGFVGQDVVVDPRPAIAEPAEGVDRDRVALFDRYSAAAAILWSRGLYPKSAPGEVVEVGAAASASPLAQSVSAQGFFERPAAALTKSPVPWVRGGKAARLRSRVWPWLAFGPALFLVVPHRLSAAALAVAGCGAVALGLRALALREKLRSVPVSKVRSMAMGLVQISGRTVATAPLKAPYSHLECVWYCFDVQERQQLGENTQGWRTVAEGSSSDIPFRVEDGTGSVLVQPSDAEIDVDSETVVVDSDTRAREWLLPAGIPVFVTGFARRRSTDPGQALQASGAPSDSDEVFVGSDASAPFTIATQTRGQEQSELRRESLFGIVAGGAYLVAALVLWLALAP